MRFPVPQFINVEDKIAGPLTWTQLYWMIAMGAMDLILWKSLPLGYFIVIGLLVTTAFCALAFWRPWGQPLIKTIWHMIVFVFRPKSYFWQRMAQEQGKTFFPLEETKIPEKRSYEETLSQIQTYAKTLDNPLGMRKDNEEMLASRKRVISLEEAIPEEALPDSKVSFDGKFGFFRRMFRKRR